VQLDALPDCRARDDGAALIPAVIELDVYHVPLPNAAEQQLHLGEHMGQRNDGRGRSGRRPGNLHGGEPGLLGRLRDELLQRSGERHSGDLRSEQDLLGDRHEAVVALHVNKHMDSGVRGLRLSAPTDEWVQPNDTELRPNVVLRENRSPMKLIPLILTATLALTALPVFGDYAILLPEGTNVAITLCTGLSGATPVRCTATSLTGFTSGQTVWIHGVQDNRAVNGLRKIQVINSTQFDVYTTADVAVAPNGNWVDYWTAYPQWMTARPVMSATVSKTLVDWPRGHLDGPTGTYTTTLASRIVNNPVYTKALANLDPILTSKSNYEMPSPGVFATYNGGEFQPYAGNYQLGALVSTAALAYKATGQSKYFDFALYWLKNIDSCWPGFVFDEGSSYGGDFWNADYSTYYLNSGAMTYALLRNDIQESDRVIIRGKFLNDRSIDGSTADCNLDWMWAPDGNTVNLTAGYSTRWTVTGNGTKWLTDADTNNRLNPGDFIQVVYKTAAPYICPNGTNDGSCSTLSWSEMIKSVDSDTQVTLVKTGAYNDGGFPAKDITGTGYRIRRAWSTGSCGVGWSHKHNYTGSLAWGFDYKLYGYSGNGPASSTVAVSGASKLTTTWLSSPYAVYTPNNKTGSRAMGQMALGLSFAGDDARGDEELRLAWFVWTNQWRQMHRQSTTGEIYESAGDYYSDRMVPESVWPSWWAKNSMGTAMEPFTEKYLKFHLMAYVPDTSYNQLMHCCGLVVSTFNSYYTMLGIFPLFSEYRDSDWQKGFLYAVQNWSGIWPNGLGAGWNQALVSGIAAYDDTMTATNPDTLSGIPKQYAFNKPDAVNGPYGTEDGMDAGISRTGFAAGNTFFALYAPINYSAISTMLDSSTLQYASLPGSMLLFRKHMLLGGQTRGTDKGIHKPESTNSAGYWSGNDGSSVFMIGTSSSPYGWNMSVKPANGVGQLVKTQTQKIRSSRTSDNTTAYFNADMAGIYATTTGVTYINRKTVDFKKPTTTQVIMVADIASISAGNTIASYWHFANNGYTNAQGTEGATTLSADTVVSRNPSADGNSLLVKFLKPAGANTVAIIDDNDTYPFSTGSTHRVTTAASTDGATINTSATSTQMLACMELVDDQTTTGVPCSLLGTVDANYFGAQFSDNSNSKVGVFSKDATLRTSMSFTSSHAGTGQYFVDGLQDGVYSVALSGVEQTTCTVGAVVNNLQDDAGCAWDGIAGAYTVTKSGSAPSSANSVLTTGRVSFSGRVK
jgi:hypothetical protein